MGCAGCAVAGLAVALALSIFLNFSLALTAAAGVSSDGTLVQKVYDGDSFGAGNKILLLRIEGVIMSGGGGMWAEDMVEGIRKRLKLVATDPTIKGVVVRVDSPGGGITASDDIYHMLKQIKNTGKPVVVSMGGMAASGGYYVAVAADEIYAEPTTITGSIGVIISSFNVAGLMEDWKIRDVSITSGTNKDLLSMTQPVEEEHLTILKGMVDEMFQRFLDVIMEGRKQAGLTLPELKELADGRIFLAQQAKDTKLIDHIGYLDDAIAAMRKKPGLENAIVVEYQTLAPLGGLFGVQAPQKIELGIDARMLHEATIPRGMAIFRP